MIVKCIVNEQTGLIEHIFIPGDSNTQQDGPLGDGKLLKSLEVTAGFNTSSLMETFHWTPEGFSTNLPKATKFDSWDSSTKSWITDNQALTKIKDEALAELKLKTQQRITTGVECDALGTVHLYPTQITDQINLNGLVTESLLSTSTADYKFWCKDLNGIWARRVHNITQIQLVGITVANYVKEIQQEYEEAITDILTATSEAEILNKINLMFSI